MEIQIQELLERIRNEGVETAQQQAEEIIEKAKAEAEGIVAQAKKDAASMVIDAENRIKSMEVASHASLLQASRDTLLAIKQSVQKFLDSAAKADISHAFDEKVAAQIIPEILKLLASNVNENIEILLSPEVAGKIDTALASRLAKELKKGVTFRPYDGIDVGLRIGIEGTSMQYDFSLESIAQLLSQRTNQIIAQYFAEAAKSLK